MALVQRSAVQLVEPVRHDTNIKRRPSCVQTGHIFGRIERKLTFSVSLNVVKANVVEARPHTTEAIRSPDGERDFPVSATRHVHWSFHSLAIDRDFYISRRLLR